MSKYVLKKSDIKKIIKILFLENNLSNILEKSLGFKFNVNYILAYKTFNVKKEHLNQAWYANHWHKDKAYSKNVIKLIIPLHEINIQDGGIQIYDIDRSKKNLKKIKNNYFTFVGDKSDILILKPNLCYHRAGNPIKKPRSQIMLQLNPYFNWSYDTDLFKKQFLLEPKFPLLKSLISKKEKISWKI